MLCRKPQRNKMNYRLLGKTGFRISELGLGTWQVGGRWGQEFDPGKAERILHRAIDSGINFIDTADVYEGGLSEKAVGSAVKNAGEKIYIATKCGRRLDPHTSEAYTPQVLRQFVEDSLRNTGLDCIDLIQLHCMPFECYYRPEIFGEFEKLKEEGKIMALGVSVAKVEEALKAIEYDNVTAVQIIFNMFRQRPKELFFREAARRNVGIIVRVPLASGLLTGKYDLSTRFEKGDHRRSNRHGEWFDRGETFAGVDYEKGLHAVGKLKDHFGQEVLAQTALKWILLHKEVSTVIPGASRVEQVESNLKAMELPDLNEDDLEFIETIYDEYIRDSVHHLW